MDILRALVPSGGFISGASAGCSGLAYGAEAFVLSCLLCGPGCSGRCIALLRSVKARLVEPVFTLKHSTLESGCKRPAGSVCAGRGVARQFPRFSRYRGPVAGFSGCC